MRWLPRVGRDQLQAALGATHSLERELAMESPAIAAYAPRFLGGATIRRIMTSEGGRDWSGRYNGDCAYVIERPAGDSTPVERVVDSHPHVRGVVDMFEQHGIDCRDAHVLGWDRQETTKLVDFILATSPAADRA